VILITTKKSYVTPVSSDEQDKTIREVKGTVSREDGSPLLNAAILVTGTQARSSSDESGSFTLSDVPTVSRIIISARGYLTQLLKPEARLAVKMLKDPDYKESGITAVFNNYLVVLNGSISDRPYSYLSNIIQPDQIASISVIRGDDAAKKYGEKARTGAVVIITKDKAKEMGISVPFRRSKPEDFPTFKGNSHKSFTQWILEQLKYPAEAEQKGIQGRVSVSFVIEADGSVSNVKGSGDPLLTQVVADLVNSSPKWEPAANPEARQPFNTTVNLKFQLPDQITPDDVFVVTEQMPMYPGGDAALLDQIRNTTKYPQDALDQKIEGRVIVRFVVTAKGAVESATVLKGVHPSLDAEALRVVSSLGRFMPGSQGGKPVNVWYMVPVTFTLPGKEPNFSQSTTGDAPSDTVDQQPEYPGGEREMFRFIAENTVYPEEAKNLKIQGKVIVRCAVKKDGTVDRISVLKGVDPLLDNEAVRVVSLLKGFRPGMKNGAAVDSWLMIPLTFTVK
ncbi:MAG TPA: TonB family protein, partial [Bacteroidales bacterium]|nr:TonB family protein [Bacteroidales bacterium]